VKGLGEAVANGVVPAGAYSDADLFAAEASMLFPRSWQYLAHESEIPNPGDFVTRRILEDSFIVTRSDDGAVHVLLNQCRHRGMQVCRAEAGNSTFFRCPYHAWTYRNDGQLVGLPFHQEAYGGEAGFPRSETRLASPARVSSYRGLIFACLEEPSCPLEEFIGDYGFFLDFYVHQSPEGVEVRGPQRWQIECNWKIGAENFAGDSYHTPHTHASVVEIGLFSEPRASKRKEGALYTAGAGSGTTYKLPTADFGANLAHIGYPPQMIERMNDTWTPRQRALVGEAGFMVSASTLFPNLSLVHNWPRVDAGGRVAPFISLRQWQPLSPTRTEALSWFLVDRNAPDTFKDDSYRAYLMSFGTSGMFEQDDVENWTSITAVSKGWLSSRTPLDLSMGLGARGEGLAPPLDSWPAPGRAFVGYGEHNQRALLRRWAACLDPASAT